MSSFAEFLEGNSKIFTCSVLVSMSLKKDSVNWEGELHFEQDQWLSWFSVVSGLMYFICVLEQHDKQVKDLVVDITFL